VNELEHLGLSEKEAAVYLASLSLGFASIQEISERAVVNRATTYTAVEALEKHGLIKFKFEEGKRLYVSESPERFRALLSLQRKELEEKEREFLRLLPHMLIHAHPCGARPGIKLFNGEEGKKTLRGMMEKVSGPWLFARGTAQTICPIGPIDPIGSIEVVVSGLGLKTILIRDYFVAIFLEDETQLNLLFASKDLADAMRAMLNLFSQNLEPQFGV